MILGSMGFTLNKFVERGYPPRETATFGKTHGAGPQLRSGEAAVISAKVV